MNIIPQNEPLVKWTEKKKKSLKIAAKMIDAGYKARGLRMQNCGDFINFKVCPDCGKSYISSTNLCRDRLCPTCAWRLSLKKFAEMCCTLQTIGDLQSYAAGFLTLTVKNCTPSGLNMALKKMAQDWNRMLQQKICKDTFLGWARSVEITYNEKTRTFHPHFHIIVLYEPLLTVGEMNARLRKSWNKAARLDYEAITDFRAIEAEGTSIDNDAFYSAIVETFKYAVKSDDMVGMDMPTFRAFVQAIQGVRFVSYGGVVKEARKQLGYKDNDEDESDIELNKDACTACGAALVKAVLQWSLTEGQYKQFAL